MILKNIYNKFLNQTLDKKLCKKNGYWLFVLGVNNSGTTLLSKILETHPFIRSLPQEGQLLTNAFPRPDKLNVVRIWTERANHFRWDEDHDSTPALKAKIDWYKLYPKRPGILLEKSPPNTLRSRWLQKYFKPSKFITIIRNPYAVCEGMRRRNGYAIERSARHWLNANLLLNKDMPYLRECIEITYEELTEETVTCLKRIQEFLFLRSDFDLNKCLNVSAHNLLKNSLGIKNFNNDSISRLSNADIKNINNIAGRLMHKFGYSLI